MKRIVIGAILLLAIGPNSTDAQDRVVLQSPSGTGKIAITGKILRYDGQGITIQPRIGTQPKTYSVEQVLAVEVSQSALHHQAEQLLAAHRIVEAQSAYASVLRQEPRAWVRREVLATLVRCALALGDYATAGTRFLLLEASDPANQHFHLIPLLWAQEDSDSETRSRARAWISQTSEAARLIGASLLLDDPESSAQARTELQKLTTSSDVRVRSLTHAQLWRVRLRTGSMGRLELDHWEYEIGHMPEDLRGGPYYLLGRGRLLRREFEQAATAFLWLPLVYDADARLAARACLEAAQALQQIGQSENAQNLYREVTVRFGQTEFAREAMSQLQLQTPSGQSRVSDNRQKEP